MEVQVADTGYDSGMRTTKRITITVPTDLVAKVKEEVEAGFAPSVSAWITDAMWAKAPGRDFDEVLDEWLEESGGPMTEEEEAWADEILFGSSSTPEP